MQRLEAFTKPRDTTNGDALVTGTHYLAVIDGATPKAHPRVNGLPADTFAATAVAHILATAPAQLTQAQMADYLTRHFRQTLVEHTCCPADPTTERPYVGGLVIASLYRQEVWVIGDGIYRINEQTTVVSKLIDRINGGIRAAELRRQIAAGVPLADLLGAQDPGRRKIMPRLEQQRYFANRADGHPWAYSCLNGETIPPHLLRQPTPFKAGDLVILSSDGFDQLAPTWAETCAQQAAGYQADPLRLEAKATKGLNTLQGQHDDWSYLSFIA